MKLTLSLVGSALVAGLFSACYMGGGVDATSSVGDAGGNVSDAGAGGGLPCDVQAVLAAHCQSCHGSTPAAGAPMALMSYADLVAKSLSDPSKSNLEMSIARMQDAARPMPPGGGSAAADVAALSGWQSAGAPASTCDTPAEAGTDYNTPEVCTSGMNTAANVTGGSMRPGQDCMSSSCHGNPASNIAMAFGGTVYPSAHEPDLCQGTNGTSKALSVSLVDVNGKTYTAPVNRYGNFYLWLYDNNGVKLPIKAPFGQVQVVGGAAHRDMAEAAPNGRCNACHTSAGANPFAPGFTSTAPGRIMAP